MRSAMMRPIVSVGPPGANGTTSVIGRDGYDCAPAWLMPATPSPASTSVSSAALLIMVCLGRRSMAERAYARQFRSTSDITKSSSARKAAVGGAATSW
jgi:hypothetical protein